MIIPVPYWARNTWGWRLAYTLLAVASDGDLRQADEGIELYYPYITSKKLRETAGRYKERKPLLIGHDKKIFQKLVSGLCINNEKPTIGTLLEAVARAIQDPGSCSEAYERQFKPLSLVKSEYYEFVRSYGGYSPRKSTDVALAPPIYQALVLSGHAVTMLYREKDTSTHLTVADADAYHGLYTVYDKVHSSLATYLGRGTEPSTATSLLQLLAASSIAGDDNIYKTLADNNERDVFWTGKLQVGKRATVMAASQLPVAHLAVTLHNALSKRSFNKVFATAFRSLAFASARVDGSCRLHATMEMKGKEVDIARKLGSMLEEYSQHLVLYAYTGDPIHAYAAARVAKIAQQSREAQKALICPTYCKAGSCQAEMEPASDKFSILAEAAVRLLVNTP